MSFDPSIPVPQAITFAEFRAEALDSLFGWDRAVSALEADLIAQGAPAEDIERLERLSLLYGDLRCEVQRLDATAIGPDEVGAVIRAWRRLAEQVASHLAGGTTAPKDVELIRRAVRLLRERLARFEDTSSVVHEVFSDAELSAEPLRSALEAAVAGTDWHEAERHLGVAIPEAVRRNPVHVRAGADAFGGRASIRLSYAPWAAEAVRKGVQRLFNREWLPEVRAKAGHGALGARQNAAPAEAQICQVLFGTNRAYQHGRFSRARASGLNPLRLGEARVSVPNRRKVGHVPRPWRLFGIGLPADSAKHIALVASPDLLSEADFTAKVRAADENGAALLFVHGYNTTFEGGLWRTAQLAVDLEIEGPVFHYAWPSGGKPALYDYDAESVKGAGPSFKTFVRTILDQGKISALSVVAHSKGNELVLDAFKEMAVEAQGQPRARHLVLASPDVDESVGRAWLPQAQTFFESVTLYANAHDRPLMLSAGKAHGPRLGGMMADDCPFIASGVDSIDAANTDFGFFGFNHDAYVDAPILRYDLSALLKRGTRPPDQRSPVIRPQQCSRGQYWKVATE